MARASHVADGSRCWAFPYNRAVQTWDTVIVGAGAIGLSLARRLRQHGLRVLIIDKGEPGREASYAAGGMIAHCDPQIPPALKPLAHASAAMYPQFVRELQAESGESPDLRDGGTLAFFDEEEAPGCEGARRVGPEEFVRLEPALKVNQPGYWLPERSVDPRALCSALVKVAKHSGVDFVTGSAVMEVETQEGRVLGVKTANSHYAAGIVVNSAGAWASQLQPFGLPTRPAKGQMVCVVPAPDDMAHGPLVQHVVRTPDVYIIPRSDRRILLGATLEDAGFDKRTDADTVEKLYRAAVSVVPGIGGMRIHDSWAGLRPAAPDKLPILGATSLPGYFAATGHYRDGIMLAPITAEVMARVILGQESGFELRAFSALRFA